jgi:hypothetical protein
MGQQRDQFPEGLDQKVFTEKHMIPEAFPLDDPRKTDIQLGQLLSMSAGIRGTNPGYVRGEKVTLSAGRPIATRSGCAASTDGAIPAAATCATSSPPPSMVVRKLSGNIDPTRVTSGTAGGR